MLAHEFIFDIEITKSYHKCTLLLLLSLPINWNIALHIARALFFMAISDARDPLSCLYPSDSIPEELSTTNLLPITPIETFISLSRDFDHPNHIKSTFGIEYLTAINTGNACMDPIPHFTPHPQEFQAADRINVIYIPQIKNAEALVLLLELMKECNNVHLRVSLVVTLKRLSERYFF